LKNNKEKVNTNSKSKKRQGGKFNGRKGKKDKEKSLFLHLEVFYGTDSIYIWF